jgi:F0F1-type ATP synthase assembly protein I
MPADRKNTAASTIRTLGALSAVGFAFVLAVVIGFFVGYGLDRLTGLSPLFTILFFFFGLAAGIVNVVRTASAVSSQDTKGSADPKTPADRP